MNQFALKNSKKSRFLFEYGNLMLAFISVVALVCTFAITMSEFFYTTKILAFAFIVIVYLFTYVILNTLQKNQVVEIAELPREKSEKRIFESDTEEKLLVLEEAGKFFGASLKTVDMFRLLSSRIAEIIPHSTFVVFQINQENKFTVPYASGKNARLFESTKLNCGQGIAGKAFLSRDVEFDSGLELDKLCIESEFLKELDSAIAIPLFQDGEIHNVIVLYGDQTDNFDSVSRTIAEAVGVRITPLINSSIAFEKNLSNAMTDSLTSLPNERAFYLVLENQVAEAQRFAERRSLTILAIDIQNFSELNEKFGHSVGDLILAETANRIKQQIRRMDFIARTVNDEFLVVLPTATGEITEQVIERVKKVFINEPIRISNTENCRIDLNFGSASFQNDGETAEQLLKTALIRKQHSKVKSDNSVLLFPKQYAN